MANQSLRALAPSNPVASPRRRLAQNVVCLFADERQPVANLPRRGRLPKAVAQLRAAYPLRQGALCEFSAEDHASIPVRIIEMIGGGRFHVEAVAGYEFSFPEGVRSRAANVICSTLRRSAVIDLQYQTTQESKNV